MKKLLYIIILILLPFGITFGQAHIVFQNGYIVEHGGTAVNPVCVVLSNSNANAIVPGTGWFISENEFDILQWNIGTATGTYTVPFGYSNLKYLPLTFNINTAGVGAGVIKFSTYHTAALNSAVLPTGVSSVTPFILPGSPSNADNSYNIVDRFYIIDANTGYTTKPAAGNITFSYISGTPSSEVAAPNTLTESRLMAERYNTGTNTWSDWFGEGCTDAIVNNVGTVQTGPVPAIDMYRAWSLWDNLTPLPLTLASTNITCNGGANGTATVTAYGGESPYTYSWTGGGGNNSTATGLSAGTYTVTVNDNHGCLSTTSITITQPAITTVVSISSQTNPACNGGAGSATASAGGGTAPYTYLWTGGGGTNATASGLSAGSYTITAIDNKGCSGTASVSIIQPVAVGISIASVTTVSCTGIGSITSHAATGGTGPYNYSWSPSGGTNLTASNLSAGTYTITVRDVNGCSASAEETITMPAQLNTTASTVTNVNCYGENSGCAASSPSGGTAPYTYSWFPGAGTHATEGGLSAGTYTITVTDNNGCSATAKTTITQPTGMVIKTDSIDAGVGACNGMAAVTIISGGTAPFTYLWSPGGETTDTIKPLCEGSYCCTVTQANGCSQDICIIVETNTGIGNIGNNSSINIYPNPSNGQFTISGVEKGMLVEIYDYIGREISNMEADNRVAQVNIADQPNGIYLIRIVSKEGTLVSENKVVKTQ